MSCIAEIVDTLSESTAVSASTSQCIWVAIAVFLAGVVSIKSMHKKLPPTALEILEKETTAIDDVLKKGIEDNILPILLLNARQHSTGKQWGLFFGLFSLISLPGSD